MSRKVVLSNGELHVGINCYGLVHDLYFPYVGLENHVAGKSLRHRIGVWVDGEMSWLDSGAWTLSFSNPHNALIGHTKARNDTIGVLLEFDDAVDSDLNALIRNIHIVNMRDHSREIRLFMHHAFAIGDSRSYTDTAQYLPETHALLHYRGRRAFMMGATTVDGQPFDQYTTGLFGIEGREGSWRDAEDGELSMCPVENGRVDSVMRLRLTIDGHSSTRVHYWLAAGKSPREALFVFKKIRDAGVHKRLESTAHYWHKWLRPAEKVADTLNPSYRSAFLRSVLVIASHIDKRGAVIASTDSTMLNYGRDTYAYCWPRDAAYVLWPLMRLGYRDETARFLKFCQNNLHPSGYLMHKFRADGGLGSSWHPYIHPDGTVAPPIQEDETAIVVFLAAQHYHLFKDTRQLGASYESMIKPMADFMSGYIDDVTGLPKPSYDLWEQDYMISTYTTAVVYAALQAAAELADVMHDATSSVKWRSAAEDIYRAASHQLYNAERKMLYRGIRTNGDERIPDEVLDLSSFYGAFMFGLFPAHGEELSNAAATLAERFHTSNERPGLPRYENDAFYRDAGATESNWWYVTTCWMAEYFAEVGRDDDARATLDWIVAQLDRDDVLSEQVDPATGAPKSVAPLAWSHAELIAAMLDSVAGGTA